MAFRIILVFFTQFILFDQIAGQRFVFHTNSIKDSTSLANEEITYWGIFDVATCQASIFHERLAVEEFKDVVILPDSSIYTYSLGNRIGEGIGRFYPERRLLYFYPMPSFVDNKFVEALSCNGNGVIYGAGLGLTEFNPITRRHNYLGDLPREMQAAGDITFRGGKLYLSTISNTLVEVNINNPINSRVVMTFPVGTPPIHAMTTVQGGCNEVVTYAVGTDSTGSIIYELDFENKTLVERCRTPWTIIGAASQQECVTPVCKVYVDLDQNNSSGGSRYDFHPGAVCNASVPIADQDLEVYAEEAIDSVIITLTGILDVGLENLTAAVTANLSLNGSGTNKIRLANLGSATVEDFRRAIARIFYKNNSPAPTSGNREVWVRGYTSSYVGEISTARIRIENNLALEQDRISLKCYGDSGITFTAKATGGVAPYKYQWANGDTIATRTGLAVGSYPVAVADQSGCRLLDTVQVTQPDSLWLRIQAVNDSICGASGQLSASVHGGTAPYMYQWSHNASINQAIVQNLEPGNYIISVIDQSGCQATGNYRLVQSDTLRTQAFVKRCTGETFEWQSESIRKDTSFCIRLTSVNGCDSLHCVNVEFLDSVLVQESIMLCNNDTYSLNGQIISSDTIICNTFTGANGCDSTYCFTIRVHKRINQFTASICEGESYVFAGKTFTTTGIYADTIQDGGSCDSLIILNLIVAPKPNITLIPNGILCAGGTLKIDASPGYNTYQWSNGGQTPSITIDKSGQYALTVTSAVGCADTASIEILESNIEAVISKTDPTCFGSKDGRIRIDSVIGGNPPFFYRFNTSAAQPSNEFQQLAAGTYEVEVEDNNGCLVQTTVNLKEPEPLTLALGDDTALRLGDSLVLTAQTNALDPLIQWNPAAGLSCATCLSTIAKPIESIRYEVTLTDKAGCTAKDAIFIRVNPHANIYIPNAFSPNGDGVNDVFTVFADGSVERLAFLRVFDRWGNLVFEAKDVVPGDTEKGWDGAFNGKVMPMGTYVYTLQLLRIDGVTEKVQGEVLLVR